MSPRPRKASDEEVFAATYRAMQRVGPGELTLAVIAEEAGLTAGALVQRFGSRRGLMVALMTQFTADSAQMLVDLRTSQTSPLAALRRYAECFAGMVETPAMLAHHLAYLQMDLTDPDLREQLRLQSLATRATIKEWLDEAVESGELAPGVDTAALARGAQSMISGSMMSYAFLREGTATAWLRADLDILLRPHLAQGTAVEQG